ncbi:MAG: translocation/assembly module TamB domain-containing protein [Paracoccaceae bacterium]|nr:translocation/assembly module TamB domain-containing protein [Paracoccaceae bacterium]
MRFRWLLRGLFVLFLLVPIGGAAQDDEDDGGFLTRTIQDLLSGAGREVKITGFAGALSSEASFERMTIADDEGIWLTLEDVKLNWSRLALLRGQLEVNNLSAASLDLPRLPEAEETVEVPSAEAAPFALPDLPVSVNIDVFEVTRIDLGEPIVGTAAALGVKASIQLNDEGAFIDLTAQRVDDADGNYVVKGSFAREGSEINVDIALDEAPGGIAGHTMNLPGKPSIDLTVAGTGPLDDFTADIGLATDGMQRVAGQVTLNALPSEVEGAQPDRRIRANLGGDITALVAPQSRDFFGTKVALNVDALLGADGAVDVSDFALDAKAVQLAGKVKLNSDQWPTFIDVDGTIAQADGQPVLLPGSDVETTVQSIELSVDYDAQSGDVFAGAFDITQFAREGIRFENTLLALDGTLQGDLGSVGRFLGDLDLTTRGLALDDPEAAEALGQEFRGKANIDYVEDEPIRITGLELVGADYGLSGDVIIQGLDGGIPTDIDLSVQAAELARFAGLAGQSLAGAAQLDVAGSITPLSSIFDLKIGGTTRDLKLDIPQADAVMAGVTALTLQARRDETGTFVQDLDLKNDALDITGDIKLQTNASDVKVLARLNDVALVLPQYTGPLSLDAKATQDAIGWAVDVVANAPYDSSFSVKGVATGPETDVQFDLSVPEVQPLVEAINGPLDANGRVWLSDAGYNVDVDAAGPFQSEVSVAGLATGPDAAVAFLAAMPDIGVFVPKLAGPLSIEGDAARDGADWQIDTAATGPAGTEASVKGRVGEDGTLDLGIIGAVPLGLSDPFLAPRSLQGQAQFDLTAKGAPGLDAISGTISSTGATFADPGLRLALTDLITTINLNGGDAQLDLGGAVEAGGTLAVAGGLNLNSLVADLKILLNSVVLSDPRLYSTLITADIAVAGPLTGGARIGGTIDIGETLISVPSSGLTSIGEIPEITHVGAPQSVTTTRGRAGVIPEPEEQGNGGAGSVYDLGLQITAPNKIFVRGRGVDAELGGGLEVTGTTARVISAGQFDLVRGRIDILGKRFELEEGSIQFQGDLVPYIRFKTLSDTDDGTASIVLDGPVDEPEVTFEAVPEAPQDEVLSQLLFGRKLSEISGFQALQLANAVAVLAGKSGVGIVGNLRKGFGLDDFDVTTTDDGEAAVRAGKYITDTIYTDVFTGGGETELSINLELTDSLKARGTVENDGNTGIGLFFERDY